VFAALVDFLSFLLTIFAGPYRALAYRPRAFGGIREGVVTWLGIAIAYPVSWASWPGGRSPGDSAFAYCWGLLGLAAYAQMMARWVWGALDEKRSHSWAGDGEIAQAAVLAGVAAWLGSPGAGCFVLAGYAASLAKIGLARLRPTVARWGVSDAVSLAAPVVGVTRSTANGSAAVAGRWIPVLAERWAAFCAVAVPTAMQALRSLGNVLSSRAVVPVSPEGGSGGSVVYINTPRQSSFRSRLTAFFIGHWVLGLFGFSIVLKLLAIPMVIFLWFLGFPVGFPGDVKEHVQATISRAQEAMADAKDELGEKVHDKKEAIKRRFGEKKEELAEKAEEKARGAFWKIMFH